MVLSGQVDSPATAFSACNRGFSALTEGGVKHSIPPASMPRGGIEQLSRRAAGGCAEALRR